MTQIKDLKNMFKDIRDIVNAPMVNIMLLFGFLLLIFSFCKFDGIKKLLFPVGPNWVILVIGIASLISGIVVFKFTREEVRINKKANIETGISFKFEQILVNLKKGKIQEIPNLDQTSGVVLPANTTFVDDCITDINSALGAFFLKYHTDKISKAPQNIEKQLEQLGYQRNDNGTYPVGATIILPEEYDTPAKTIITASTIRKEISGIRAEPSTICECIRQIFMRTADKKIAKLYMPILGSGHGGININESLLFLILAIKHYSKYYHHVKSIDIIIIENDVTKLKKDIYRLQYLTLLEGAKR